MCACDASQRVRECVLPEMLSRHQWSQGPTISVFDDNIAHNDMQPTIRLQRLEDETQPAAVLPLKGNSPGGPRPDRATMSQPTGQTRSGREVKPIHRFGYTQ